MTAHPHAASMPRWLSRDRFDSYVRAAGGDVDAACRLYEWSIALSAAAFEAVHYLEVVMRNSMDEAVSTYKNEQSVGIPWFLIPICEDNKTQDRIDRDVVEVRQRLRRIDHRRERRGQIIAGLSFGFWVHLLGPKHETLWRRATRHAFSHSTGNRKDVSATLAALNQFRNRLAHHDSLLSTDVPFRLSQIDDVLTWIDPDAAHWLRTHERITSIMAARPVGRRDTVVVAARDAWPLYQNAAAYVCQAGRSFKPVDYIAFYANAAVQPEVAHIDERVDNVDWSIAGENHLRATKAPRDLRIADVIAASRAAGWVDGRYQVFLLTRPGEPKHLTLQAPVPHQRSGRGSAFTQSQRYAVREDLRTAQTTEDL